MFLKIRMSLLTLLGSLLALIWHHQSTGGKLILSDIPNDPNVSEGWPWVIGALGVIGLVLTLVSWMRENDILEQRKQRRIKRAELAANEQARLTENRRAITRANFENYQGGFRVSRA